jgi:uncharacterized protein YbjT (DUF2867 family)
LASVQRTILVLGATGNQGGATARHLLASGWHVRVLVRDPNKPAAQALRQDGAEVVQGTIDDRASLEEITQGVYGVFSVQPISSEDEARQGKNVADAAKAAGVQHFVYTSVGAAERLSHHRINVNKWEIEQYIQRLSLPATILRPVMFMDMLVGPPFGVTRGTLATAIKPDVVSQLIAVDDIGAFAALAFDHPDSYLGKTIEIAGDALTPQQIAATISRVTGQSISYVQVPIETIRQQSADFARAFDLINEGKDYPADIPALRKMHPGLMDFDTWLKKVGKAKFEASQSTTSAS